MTNFLHKFCKNQFLDKIEVFYEENFEIWNLKTAEFCCIFGLTVNHWVLFFKNLIQFTISRDYLLKLVFENVNSLNKTYMNCEPQTLPLTLVKFLTLNSSRQHQGWKKLEFPWNLSKFLFIYYLFFMYKKAEFPSNFQKLPPKPKFPWNKFPKFHIFSHLSRHSV